ncbi:Pre-mRNA-splicing factor CWC21 [Xylariaceae sp. FL0804]|nr:Pre-mRNA-splicing factor CWC21 [Xylariaceae sp. FL0804]
MSDNVGLSTPRGSGTSGYVQRNLAHLRPRERDRAGPYARPDQPPPGPHRPRQPDRGILEHDRRREVEVKVFELRDRLEDEETRLTRRAACAITTTRVDEAEIDKRCAALRAELQAEMERGGGISAARAKSLKSHQVHELAEAKMRESERLRSALKISRDYEEGDHWRRQEDRMRRAVEDGDGDGNGAGKREEDGRREQYRGGRERDR